MAIGSSGDKRLFTEINITPLTDIFLVLLIIMMVIAPMFQDVDNNIKLPQINSGLNVDDKEVTVSITEDSHFFLNSKPVEEKQLAESLAAVIDTSKDKKLVVKADGKTKTKYIVAVMNAAQEAGYEKLTVAGEPLSKKQQNDLESGKVEKVTGENDGRNPVELPQ